MLLLAEWLAANHEVSVVAVELEPRLANKVRWIRLPSLPKAPFIIQALYLHLIYDRWLRRAATDFDIVHSTSPIFAMADVVTFQYCPPASLDLFRRGAMRYQGRQISLTLRYNAWPHLKLTLGSFLERRCVHGRRDTEWVAVSHGLAQELQLHYEPDAVIRVIPNANRPEMFADFSVHRPHVRSRLGVPETAVLALIMALGDWPRKGLFDLLLAARYLEGRTRLLVVGGGPLDALRKHCRDLGIADRVIFAGPTDDPRVWYAAADLFVFPSYYEAFPIAPLEAAACGLPIISTRVNGITEWVRDGIEGIFVSHEPQSVAGAINTLASDPGMRKRFGGAARAAAVRYSVDRMCSAYETLYYERLSSLRAKDLSVDGASRSAYYAP